MIWRMKGSWERRGRVRWLLHSQRVQIWQSFAQGRPTQRHCAPVTAALQQQMKLSAGRWLYSDSRSTLSLQSVADKYVGFQSCQGRRWTVGQGAKRRAKAFPSPRNLFSMSLVTSRGTHSVWAIQRAPGPQISHTACWGSSVSLSLPVTAITLSPLSLFFLSVVGEPKISSTERNCDYTKRYRAIYDRLWFCVMRMKWLFLITFPLMVKSNFITQVTEKHWFVFCCVNGADRPSAVWGSKMCGAQTRRFFHLDPDFVCLIKHSIIKASFRFV